MAPPLQLDTCTSWRTGRPTRLCRPPCTERRADGAACGWDAIVAREIERERHEKMISAHPSHARRTRPPGHGPDPDDAP